MTFDDQNLFHWSLLTYLTKLAAKYCQRICTDHKKSRSCTFL